MTHYYKFVSNYDTAERMLTELEALGVNRGEVNILMKSGANAQPADHSMQSICDTDINIKDGPSGSVSAIGAATALVTGITSGIMVMVAGPVAAAVGGAAVAAGGVVVALTGIGVPEEEHSPMSERIEAGDVLVQLNADNDPHIAAIFA